MSSDWRRRAPVRQRPSPCRILSRIDSSARRPQALVLTPTRELALQVAEAITRYAKHLPELHVLPVYGGAQYSGQLAGLRKGAQIIVGTPGG